MKRRPRLCPYGIRRGHRWKHYGYCYAPPSRQCRKCGVTDRASLDDDGGLYWKRIGGPWVPTEVEEA